MKNMVDKIRFSSHRPWFGAGVALLLATAAQLLLIACRHP